MPIPNIFDPTLLPFDRINQFTSTYTSLPKCTIILPGPCKTRFIADTVINSKLYNIVKLNISQVTNDIFKALHYDIYDEIVVGLCSLPNFMLGRLTNKTCHYEIYGKLGVMQGGVRKKKEWSLDAFQK